MIDRRPGWTGGHVIDNPITGERIAIRQSGADTEGRLLSFDLFLPPGGHVPATHAHPVQEERFTVLSGQMRFKVGRRTILAAPGETVLVAPGSIHWFANASDTVAVTRVEVRPALRTQELLERSGSIAHEGRRLRGLAALLLEFQRELAVPHVPAFIVRLCLTPLANLG